MRKKNPKNHICFVQNLHESNIAVCNDVFWGFIMSDKSMNLQTLKTFYTPVNK